MSFLKDAANILLGGGLLGFAAKKLLGKKKKQDPIQPRQVTRDDAAAEAERERDLARRRGAAADRSAGGSGEATAGIGRFVIGS